MNKVFLIAMAVSFMLTAQAQTPAAEKATTKTTTKITTTTTTTETTQEPSATDTIKRHVDDSVKAADKALDASAARRATRDYGFYLIYSPIDLLIPGKIGGSFYFTSDDNLNQYEISYLRASLSIDQTFGSADVASITEQKFSFLNRNFSPGSSFNWFYGLSYAAIESHLGKDYINSLPPGSSHDPDLLQVDVLALDIGLGNRWYFENGVTLGVDWIGVTQPVATLKKKETFTDQTASQNDKDDVNKFISFVTSFPRIYTLKMQLGYSF